MQDNIIRFESRVTGRVFSRKIRQRLHAEAKYIFRLNRVSARASLCFLYREDSKLINVLLFHVHVF